MLLSTPSRKRRNMSLWYIERNGKPWRITTACRLKLTSVAISASSKLGTITTSKMKSSSGLRLLLHAAAQRLLLRRRSSRRRSAPRSTAARAAPRARCRSRSARAGRPRLSIAADLVAVGLRRQHAVDAARGLVRAGQFAALDPVARARRTRGRPGRPSSSRSARAIATTERTRASVGSKSAWSRGSVASRPRSSTRPIQPSARISQTLRCRLSESAVWPLATSVVCHVTSNERGVRVEPGFVLSPVGAGNGVRKSSGRLGQRPQCVQVRPRARCPCGTHRTSQSRSRKLFSGWPRLLRSPLLALAAHAARSRPRPARSRRSPATGG